MKSNTRVKAEDDVGPAWNPVTGKRKKWLPESPRKASKKFAPIDKTIAWAFVKWNFLKEPVTAFEAAVAVREDRRTVQNLLLNLEKRQLVRLIPSLDHRPKMEKKYKITRKGVLWLAARHVQYEIEKLPGEYEEDPLKTRQKAGFPMGAIRNFHSMLLEEDGSLIGLMEGRLTKVRTDSALAQRVTDFSSDPLRWVERRMSGASRTMKGLVNITAGERRQSQRKGQQ